MALNLCVNLRIYAVPFSPAPRGSQQQKLIDQMLTLIAADPVVVIDGHSSFLVGVLMLATLVFGIYWAPVIDFAERSLLFVGR